MKKSEVDVLIVGAGPAGLSAAIELKRLGVKLVRVIEREKFAGGVPRHSFHPGYGIGDLKRFISGPRYANYYVNKAVDSGVVISTQTTATNWQGEKELQLTSQNGVEVVKAKAVILATGARERPRTARLIAGKRPTGIYTTGSLQQATYLEKQLIGKKALVVGAEHVSFSAVITLKHAGVKTIAMICSTPKHQTVFMLPTLMKLLYKFKLMTSAQIVEIMGAKRVTGVEIECKGKKSTIEVDTIVFTGDWAPDHELVRKAGFKVDEKYKSPIVSKNGQIPNTMVFAIGNLVLPIKAADKSAINARKVARYIVSKLN